jgi:uncharacterized protein (DUF2267 family)
MDDRGHVGSPLGAPFEGAAEDFFRAIDASGALPVGIDAHEASSAVLCVLLSRLGLEQGRAVLDALPGAVQEALGPCPVHGGEPGERLDARTFLARIGQHFELEPEGALPITAAVLQALRASLPPKPASVVERELPAELRALLRRRL